MSTSDSRVSSRTSGFVVLVGVMGGWVFPGGGIEAGADELAVAAELFWLALLLVILLRVLLPWWLTLAI